MSTATKAVVIPPEGDPQEIHVTTLESLQEVVGGYVEGHSKWPNAIAYINEDGKQLNLPINDKASQLFQHVLHPGDSIRGAMLVCGKDSDGEHIDIPDDVKQEVMSL